MVQGGEFVLSVQVDRLGKLTDYNPIITPGYNCGNKIWNKKGSFPLYRSINSPEGCFVIYLNEASCSQIAEEATWLRSKHRQACGSGMSLAGGQGRKKKAAKKWCI